MSLVIPDRIKRNLEAGGRHVSPSFVELLETERTNALQQLADAAEDRVVRQLQGRVRLLKELLDTIRVYQR